MQEKFGTKSFVIWEKYLNPSQLLYMWISLCPLKNTLVNNDAGPE